MADANWLYATAVLVALVHAILGPDHYLPFVAMARAGGWSLRKTTTVTALCGVGHVLGSVALGMLGLAMGIGVSRLERWEAFRGDLAGCLLLGFGLAYLVWGIRHALRNRPHTHLHVHTDGTVHAHEHTHHAEHLHLHARCNQQQSVSEPGPARSGETCESGGTARYTPWLVFTIFLFGPCEPLIPLLMYPAAKENFTAVTLVVLLFGITTILTMVGLVLLGAGLVPLSLPRGSVRYGHALAGLVIAACGAAVQMGL